MGIPTEQKGLWRLDSIPLVLQLSLQGLQCMQSDFTTLPRGLMPSTTWPNLHNLIELLSSAISSDDLKSTRRILGVCCARLDHFMAQLAQQVWRFLGYTACMALPRMQLVLAEILVGTTLLAHQTTHQAVCCAMLLVPDSTQKEAHGCACMSAVEAALSKQHQALIMHLTTGGQRQLHAQESVDARLHSQQLEQVRAGSQWRATVWGCLVNVHKHYALILAAQQDADKRQLAFASAASHQSLLIANAAMLAKEVAGTYSFVGMSVLRTLVHVLCSWQVDMPPALLHATNNH